jgi:hypothetical protein
LLQPHWNIATRTPYAAPIGEYVHDRRLDGNQDGTEHHGEKDERQTDHDCDQDRKSLTVRFREIDDTRGLPADENVRVRSFQEGITSERRSSTSSAVSCSCGEVVGNAVMTAASPASLTNGGVIPAMPAHVLSSSRDRA